LFQKRTNMDIIAEILSEANEGTKKTHIMYRCNLSYTRLRIYLQNLHDSGLLAFHSKKKDSNLDYIRTTSKGLEFLDAYHDLKSLMNSCIEG